MGGIWSSCFAVDTGTTAESGDCVLECTTPAVARHTFCIWPNFAQLWHFAFLSLLVLRA